MKDTLISLRFTMVLLLICCGLYTGVVWAVGQVAFKNQSEGSLVERNGVVIGSRLIGQDFHSPRYFHGRPSAVNYNAAGSAGTNYSNTNPALLSRIQDNLTSATELDGLSTATIASDRFYASGSGLDPDISVQNALQQAERISRERGLSLSQVQEVIEQNTHKPFLRLFGPSGSRVLEMNLQLDVITSATTAAAHGI